MFSSVRRMIGDFMLQLSPGKYKRDFETSINEINISRGKVTSITFIILEILILLFSLAAKKEAFFKPPNMYYGVMYVLMIIAMLIHLLVFNRLGKDILKYRTSIQTAGISYVVFILLWCAGISLLDQLSFGGQVIVYSIALISVAATSFYEPATLLFIYLAIHIIFLALMAYVQKSSEILFGNYVNSTSFLIVSWIISSIRYKGQVEAFNNRRIIQEKSEELERVNRELEEANQKLEKLSQTDSLTGIYNRLMFDRTMKIEWDRCKRHFISLSLIMIDIDYFKAYNDNYGHQAGDDCLRKIAAVLSSCARRSSDIVTRYGGEEFAIILPHMEKENAIELAEKMRSRVEELNLPHEYSSVSDHVTISLGVYTVVPSDSISIEAFIGAADKALYKAKRENRNNTVSA